MDFYSALSVSLSKEEIEKEVENKIDAFHGLLTRDVALKLIAKERGLFKEEEQQVKIKDIKPGMRKINIIGKIAAINKENTYPSGKRARAIVIKDDTAAVSLTLWNDDIKMISNLKVGDEVLVKSAYEKLGSMSLGYKGTLEVVSAAPYYKLGELVEGSVNVRAFINAVEGKKEYEKNGKKSSFFSFNISDSTGERRCIIWGIHNSQNIIVGNEVIIQNALFRNNEIHINERTRLLVRKAKDVISGKLLSMEAKDGKLVLNVDGKIITLNRVNALKFFSMSISDDIALETLAGLKAESMLDKTIYINCKEQNGEFVILE